MKASGPAAVLSGIWLFLIFGIFTMDFFTRVKNPFEWIFGRGSRFVFNGTLARRLDQHLVQTRSFVFTKTRPFLSLWIFKLTGQAQASIGIGREGWLFHEWTLQDKGAEGETATRKGARNLLRTCDLLKRSGIEVLMVVVPNKVRIYPEFLYPSGRLPVSREPAYARWIADLRAHGVRCVDLESVFRRARVDEKLPDLLYFTGDHHWTDTGCMLACETVAREIRQMRKEWCDREPGRVKLRTSSRDPGEESLYRLLGFPPGALKDVFVRESWFVDVEPDSLFSNSDRQNSPIILNGDSYAALRLRMASYLEYQLQSPVRDISVAGGKMDVGLRKWLEGNALADKKPRILIWECWEATILQNPLDQLSTLNAEYGGLR